jgi:hypothetical protein
MPGSRQALDDFLKSIQGAVPKPTTEDLIDACCGDSESSASPVCCKKAKKDLKRKHAAEDEWIGSDDQVREYAERALQLKDPIHSTKVGVV